MASLEVNNLEFDNEKTLLFKWANRLNSPTKYVYIDPSNGEYNSVSNYISDNYAKESLKRIYQKFIKLINITPKDIAILYVKMILLKNFKLNDALVPIKNMYDHANSINVEENDLVPFTNEYDLSSQLEIFNNEYNNLLVEERELLETYIGSQKNLKSITNPVITTELKIETVSRIYTPVFHNGDEVSIDDGVDIFSDVTPSFCIPYIQYNDKEGKSKFWIYSGNEENKDVPNFNYTIQTVVDPYKQNKFFLTVCTVKNPLTDNINKNSYIKVVYDLNNNTIKIPSPVDDDGIKNMKLRVESAFTMLKFNDKKESSIKGNFMIENLDIIDSVMHYLIMRNPIMKTYLYIRESKKSRADTVKLSIKYRPLGEEKKDLNLENEDVIPLVSISFATPELEEILKIDQSGTIKYIKVNFKAVSTPILKEFINIFKRLMRIYINQLDDVSGIFEHFIPGSTKHGTFSRLLSYPCPSESVTSSISISSRKTGKNQINIFKSKNDILIENVKRTTNVEMQNYCKECSCPLQPIVIPEDEIEAWKNLTYTVRSGSSMIEQKREIGEFPLRRGDTKNLPKFYYVCPENEAVYPYLKERKDQGSLNYVPCCRKKKKVPTEEMYLSFTDNPQKISKDESKSKSSYETFYPTPVEPGRIGFLSTNVKQVLDGESIFTKKSHYLRYGIQESQSSLIHCVLFAIGDHAKAYNGLLDNKQKEEYVVNLRLNYLSKISPLIYKQEMYDYSEEEIRKKFLDPNVYLDPYLFYRGLEDHFKINIFVFNNTKKINQYTGLESDETYLEIPRSKSFHVRNYYHDRSIIIHKTTGSNPEKSHCELIVYKNSENIKNIETDEEEIHKLFDFNINEKMKKIYNQSLDMYNWSFMADDNDKLEVRHKPFDGLNWLETLSNHKILGQKIDGYGKTFVLNVESIDEEKVKHVFSMYIPPSQPLNVGEIDSIRSIDYSSLVKIMGNAVSRTKFGVWYKIIDYEEGVYIPATDIDQDLRLSLSVSPILDKNISKINSKNPIIQIRNMKKKSNILIQLIEWLWILSDKPFINLWWENNIRIIEYDEIKSNELFEIKSKLPDVKNKDQGIKYLSSTGWSYHFRDGGIYLYKELSDKCLGYFKKKEVDYECLTIKPETNIEGIGSDELDFKPKSNTMIFLEFEYLNSWLKYQTKNNNFNYINKNIKVESLSYQPYLFKFNDRTYIVQNVKDGKFRRAVKLLETWYREHINTGYMTPEIYPFKIPFPYVIYGISKGEKLIPIINETTELTTSYAEFISYSFDIDNDGRAIDGVIAALIPLF